jgi:glycosyltransferase involved in cell wall biosynthesis
MKKASVIIPTYKRVNQTLKTIEKILSSDYPSEIEVIISDCTPDNSLKTAIKKSFGTNVRYLHNEHKGISSNKNRGAEIAEGNILIFCDSDIEVEKNTIATTIEFLHTQPTVAGVTGTTFWKGGSHDGKIDRPEASDRTLIHNDVTYIEAIYSRYFGVYRNAFMNVGMYDEERFNMRGEGADLSTHFWRDGYPLAYHKPIHTHHVFDAPESVATRTDHPEEAIVQDWIQLLKKYGFQRGGYFMKWATTLLSATDNERYLRKLKNATNDLSKPVEKSMYPFSFLEVFTDAKTALNCITTAEKRLQILRQ